MLQSISALYSPAEELLPLINRGEVIPHPVSFKLVITLKLQIFSLGSYIVTLSFPTLAGGKSDEFNICVATLIEVLT